MGDLLVKRWTRYGHDRLYVQSGDGARLGYFDNRTGTTHVEDDSHRAAVDAAVQAHRTGITEPDRAFVVPTVESSAGPEPTAVATRPWTDLATNVPGESARRQAVAHRQAAPVKTALCRVLGVHNAERAWRIGTDGEKAVAAQLARLGDSWHVLHAVPAGSRGRDIDHVAIGPAGVYTINAKNRPGGRVWVGGNTVMVNGRKTAYVAQSRREVQDAATRLTAAVGFPVHVTGLIAIMGAQGGFVIKSQPPGGVVTIVTGREVATWLGRRGTVLTPNQVEMIYDQARRSTTWDS